MHGGVADRHVVHPQPLELHRVDGPAGQQVVADRDAVAALLGGPAVHPVAPGRVAPEQRGDLVVVAGQVVLGEQVDDQRRARDVRHRVVLDAPRVAVERAVEVAAVAPRDVLVGEPLLGHPEVAVEVGLHDRLELEEHLGLAQRFAHGAPSRGRPQRATDLVQRNGRALAAGTGWAVRVSRRGARRGSRCRRRCAGDGIPGRCAPRPGAPGSPPPRAGRPRRRGRRGRRRGRPGAP